MSLSYAVERSALGYAVRGRDPRKIAEARRRFKVAQHRQRTLDLLEDPCPTDGERRQLAALLLGRRMTT